MISIVAGRFRGRRLNVPKKDVRPTANRVREALFNMLQHRLVFEEYCVLDLFAGTGALGLEALSRGAKSAFFIESSRSTYSVLEQNIALCTGSENNQNGAEARINIQMIQDRAEHWLSHFSVPKNPFLIFLDPPYLSGDYEPILSLLAQHPQISSETWLAVESSAQKSLCFPDEFELLQQRSYGSVQLELLQKRSVL